MSTLDIPKLYRLARKHFTVRDDNTGQFLGYALLLPGALVDNVKLVPWLEDDLLIDDPDLAVQENTGSSEYEEEVSELDITESSSISSVTPARRDSSKLRGDQMPVINICSQETERGNLVDSKTINNIKEVKDIPNERIHDIVSHVKEKAKVQKMNVETCQDLEKESKFIPLSNLKMFYNVVEESKFDKAGMPWKCEFWKVRCVLCADGKMHSHKNFWRHIEAKHEPHLTCEICGAEFTMKRSLTRHIIRVHKERAADGCGIKAMKMSPPRLSSKARPFSSSKPVIVSALKNRKRNSNGGETLSEQKEEPLKKTSMQTAASASNSDSRILQVSEVEVVTKKICNANNGKSCGDREDDLLPVIMINDMDKNIKIKMGLKKDVKIKKAMKKFANRFNADYKKLSFVLEKTETNAEFTLTGNELVEDVKGDCIKVLGIISDHEKSD